MVRIPKKALFTPALKAVEGFGNTNAFIVCLKAKTMRRLTYEYLNGYTTEK